MIKQGSRGSINVFVNDLFISSFPITNKYNLDYYNKKANISMLKGMRDENIKLKTMIIVFQETIQFFYEIKKNKKKMSSEDHQLVFLSVLSLIKLKKIDADDYLLICGRKKPRKKSFTKKS